MDTPEKLGWIDLFDFAGANPVNKAIKSIEGLEAAYTKLTENLGAQSKSIIDAQSAIAGVLEKLSAQIAAVNIVTEAGRKIGARVARDIDSQTQSYNKLTQSQKGLTATNKSVSDSLEGLRAQIKADREELIKLGQSADPQKIQQLAGSIFETKTKAEQLEKAVRGVNSIFAAAKGSYNAIVNENRQLSLELKNLAGVFDATGQRTQESIAREAELKEKLGANTQVLKNYDAQLNQHFRNVGNYADSIIQAVRALNDEKAALLAQQSALTQNARATNLDAAAQDKLQAELAQTKNALNDVNAKLKDYGQGVGATGADKLKASIKDAGANLQSFATSAVLATVGLAAIAQGIKKVAGLNIEYSDELADVAKTTGQTIEQTNELAESLKKIDTRDSIDELLKLGEVGGQLGIAKNDIEGFIKGLDVASIALKTEFGGSVEEVATQLAKINTIFKVSDAVGIERAFLDIGSALNELGAAGAATAPFIADFARRTGQAATAAGLGLDKVLGLGAALEELGFTAEVAGTATNKLIAGLSGNSGKFYAIAKLADANLTLKQFKSLVNNDVSAALQLFLKGLRNGGTATTDFSELVKTLGLKSGGAVQVLTALAKNTELVADKQRIANEQLNNGNSLADEAAIKNNNLAASYAKTKNAIENLVVGGGAFSRFLKGLFDDTTNLVHGNIDWAESLKNLVPGYAAIKAAQGDFSGLGVIQTKKAAKAVDDYGLALELNAKTSQRTADAAETLLRQYEALNAVTNPTAAQQQKLTQITLKLQDVLGDSAVKLDKERGQYVLNTDAVSANILAKRNDAQQTAKTLAQRVVALDTELVKEQALAKAIQERATAARATVSPIIQTPGSPAESKFVDSQRSKLENPTAYGRPSITDADVANYDAYVKIANQLANANNKAGETENARAAVLANLRRIFPDLTSAQAFLAANTKETVEATLADSKATKELVKDSDALAKALYELAKFRAENRQQTFDRQSENEANDEAFRVQAAKNGAAQRIKIAEIEQAEKVRLAIKEARDLDTSDAAALAKGTITQQQYANAKLNVDKTLNVQRMLISEQYAARLKEIDRDLTKEELAIHNELLSQLREIDKIRLESAQYSLQTVIDDETQGYAIRTAAIKQYQANVILLAKAVYDGEVIEAKGSANKIRIAFDKLTQQIQQAQDKVKPFDSTLANNDTDLNYKSQQIALEQTRAAGLVTEKEYNDQKRFLENEYQKEHLTNLQVDKDGTAQALDEELALAKSHNEQRIALEKEKWQKIAEIAQAASEVIGEIGNGLFDIQKANIDNELAAVELQKQNDVALAGDNAKAKKKIEDDAARETAKLKRKQAVSERSQALFNIALNTGVAVTKAVASSPLTFGLPWSAFALANGAIQAALVLAKPIPAYAKGIDSAPAGLSLVGEAGPEILQHGGRSKLVTGPTLVNLDAGTRVINSTKTLRIFEERGLSMQLADGYARSEGIISGAQAQLNAGDVARLITRGLGANFGQLKDAFERGSGPAVSVGMDKNGFNVWVQQQAVKNKKISDRYYRGK